MCEPMSKSAPPPAIAFCWRQLSGFLRVDVARPVVTPAKGEDASQEAARHQLLRAQDGRVEAEVEGQSAN
jgi:hypothetical protein